MHLSIIKLVIVELIPKPTTKKKYKRTNDVGFRLQIQSKMANSEVLRREEDIVPLPIFGQEKGDDVRLSPFCMTNVRDWDAFRNVDMDREVSMIEALSSTKRKDHVETDRMVALNAWHRVDCRTREALRRNFLSELVVGFEECIRAFIKESGDGDVLVLHVQDPFHRLLLHGVCEFYDLVSVTVTGSKEAKPLKMTRIKKKKSGCREIPNMTLTCFLKMAKDEVVSP
ncbi:uncharacterized protein LOC131230727 isoform X2 [Magnolia sinica]|uniref:uncharacterized protein LOC131230727 isoform X2 n=1 Tax=Magnolia sinica TaxID=86752 RepID=UPI00265B3706|nr:uncharacterized protein LOC131230727 isoform X2 [Magnolia sinica]